MDSIQREVMFAGLSHREIAEALAVEMRRRRLIGCVYMFPETGGAGVFASSSPAGTMSDLSAAQQLAVLAEVATTATSERRAIIEDMTEGETDPRKIN